MESVKCEIRLLFIRQCSIKGKEAVRPWIKQGGVGVVEVEVGAHLSDLQCDPVTPG